jgi:putative effector of murein hydrolase
MAEFLEQLPLFPIALTISACLFGQWLQSKFKNPLLHPILVAAVLVAVVLTAADFPLEEYQEGTKVLSWLLTPATICLAVPLYQQLKNLKNHLPAIIAGVASGVVVSLGFILGMSKLYALSSQMTVSLLPKSITTAIALALTEQAAGITGLTTVAISITGILGNLVGSGLCRLLHITDPIAQGVSLGTSAHVIGTARATQMDPLAGAVSSLSLAVAGLLTAVLFPIICIFA